MRSAFVVLVLAAATVAIASCMRQWGAPSDDAGKGQSTPAAVTLDNPKIAPVLAATARKVRTAPGAAAAREYSTRFVHVNAAGRIQIYVHVTRVDSQTRRALSDAGAVVERTSRALGVYQIWATPAALARIAALPAVTRITPPNYGFPRHGHPLSPMQH